MSVFLVTQEYYKQVALNIIINIFANVLFGINGGAFLQLCHVIKSMTNIKTTVQVQVT